MKKIITYITFAIMVCSCSGQEKEKNKNSTEKVIYPKEKVMNTERFDTKRFENYPDVISMEDEKTLPSKKEVLADGTVIEYSFWDNEEDNGKTYYSKIITPKPPALFKIVKDFYPSGVIQRESEMFVGNLIIEPFNGSLTIKDYDHKGYLLKTTDYSDFDKNLKIRFHDLLKMISAEPMITENFVKKNQENLSSGLFHNPQIKDLTAEKIIAELKSEDCNGKILNANNDSDRKNIKISLEREIWLVTKDIYPRGFWEYKINGNTGNILDVTYIKDNRP